MIYAKLTYYLDINFGVLPLQTDLQELIGIFAPLAMEFAVWVEINAIMIDKDRWQTIPSKGGEVKTISELWSMFKMESTLLETFMGVE